MNQQTIINEAQFKGHPEKREGIEGLFPENTIITDMYKRKRIYFFDIISNIGGIYQITTYKWYNESWQYFSSHVPDRNEYKTTDGRTWKNGK